MLPTNFDFKSSLSGASLWIDTLLQFSTSFIFEGLITPYFCLCWQLFPVLHGTSQAERVMRQM